MISGPIACLIDNRDGERRLRRRPHLIPSLGKTHPSQQQQGSSWAGKGQPTPHIFLPVCSEGVEGGPQRSQSIFQMEVPPRSRKPGKRDFPSAQQMLWTRPYIGFLVLSVIKAITQPDRASQVALVVKNPPANAGDTGDVDSVGKIPWRRAWQPTLVFLLGESHRWRSLVSYSPQGPKKSDMTGQLTLPPFLITSLGSRGLPAAPPGPTCAWAAAGCHTLCVTPGPRHPGPTHPQGCPGLGLSLVRQSDSRCCLCLWAISHLPT